MKCRLRISFPRKGVGEEGVEGVEMGVATPREVGETLQLYFLIAGKSLFLIKFSADSHLFF